MFFLPKSCKTSMMDMKPLYLDTTQTKGGAIPVHWKKIIAPVIITTLLVLWFAFYLCIWTIAPIPLLLKLILCLIFMGLIGVSIYNLVCRILEIRSGEEDDLSKY